MKKIALFCILFICLSDVAGANWYGNHGVGYSTSPTRQSCDGDGDGRGGGHPTYGHRAFANNNSSSTLTPESGTANLSPSGTMRCLYWDAADPTATISYTHGWTNSTSRTISLSFSDTGGSGLRRYTIQRKVSTNAPHFGNFGSMGWSNVSGYVNRSLSGNSQSRSHTISGLQNGRAYRFRVVVEDVAGNRTEVGTSPLSTIKIDTTPPSVPTITYFDGWTNVTNQDVTLSFTDTAGSGLASYQLQRKVSTNTPGFGNFGSLSWSDVPGFGNRALSGRSDSDSATMPGISNGRAYRFRVRAVDAVGNTSAWVQPSPNRTLRIDTVPPTSADASLIAPTPTNLLATNAQNVQVNVSRNSGAPIVQVQGYFERDESNNSYSRVNSNTDVLSTSWNIQEVDNDASPNNGYRRYNFFVSYIEDQAGNRVGVRNSGSVQVQNHERNVYANTYNLGTVEVSSNNLDNASNIADGGAKNIRIDLADTYGNKIIPVSGINRTIDFNFSMNNDLRRNQYINTASGNNASAVYVGDSNNEIRIGSSQGAENASMFHGLTTSSSFYNSGSAKDFTIPFYVYAPTSNQDSRVPGNASMNSIRFDVNGSIGAVSNQLISNSNFAVRANPRVVTDFSGEIDNQGFIEGAEQNSQVIVNNNGSATIASPSLRLEFGGVVSGNNNTNSRYDLSVGGTRIAEGPQSNWSTTTAISSSLSNTSISSLLELQSGGVNTETHSYLASIVEYTLGGKQIVYPSEVLGKNSYHGSSTTGTNSYQAGTKIIGNTSTKIAEEIVTNQFDNSTPDGTVRILGNFEKSTLKSQIEKKVYDTVRKADVNSSLSDTIISGGSVGSADWTNGSLASSQILSQGKILYIQNPRNGIAHIYGSSIVGNKTLVVEGGDLYIRGNLVTSPGGGILGIIVLGGNVYIDPSVTDLHATIYTNKSVISYNGSEIDGNVDASVVADQLYIKGSVFSENTIGGSRKATPECPYYVDAVNCSSAQQAQTYDLNYLRRYFVYDGGAGYDTDTTGNSVPDKNRSGNLSQAAGSDYTLRMYPVIIDYNPQIQQTPPPLFD